MGWLACQNRWLVLRARHRDVDRTSACVRRIARDWNPAVAGGGECCHADVLRRRNIRSMARESVVNRELPVAGTPGDRIEDPRRHTCVHVGARRLGNVRKTMVCRVVNAKCTTSRRTASTGRVHSRQAFRHWGRAASACSRARRKSWFGSIERNVRQLAQLAQPVRRFDVAHRARALAHDQ